MSQLENEEVEELQEALQQATAEDQTGKKKRPFKGYILKLIVNIEGLNIETEVRHEGMKATKISGVEVEKVLRCISTGELAYSGFIGEYHKGFFVIRDGVKVEIPKEDAAYHQIIDGVEQEDTIEPFKMTKVMEVTKTVPMSKLDAYFIEGAREMWSENIPALYKFAEHLDKTDTIGVSEFTAGRGFKLYTALLYPHIEDGKYMIVIALTRTKMVFNHMMPIITEASAAIKKPQGKVAKIRTLDI